MNQFGANSVFPMMPNNQAMFAGVPRGPFGAPNPGSGGLPFTPQMTAQMTGRTCMPGPMASMMSHQGSVQPSHMSSNVGQKTNASDLYSRQSRIYVGSVSPKLSREQLISIFNKYGKVTGLSHLKGHEKGYAFVQYDNPTSAKAAVAHENNKFYQGLSFEINVVSDEKKSSLANQSSVSKGRSQLGGGSAQSSSNSNIPANRRQLNNNNSNLNISNNSANVAQRTNNASSAESGVSNLKRVAVSSSKSIQPPLKKMAQPLKKPQALKSSLRQAPVKNVKADTTGDIPATTEAFVKVSTNDFLVCGQCRTIFNDLAAFQNHKTSACERVPDVLWCHSCNQIFTNPWLLLMHAQNDHSVRLFKTSDGDEAHEAVSAENTGLDRTSGTIDEVNGERCGDKFSRLSRNEDDTDDSKLYKPGPCNNDELDNNHEFDNNSVDDIVGNTSPSGMDEEILLAEKDDISDV